MKQQIVGGIEHWLPLKVRTTIFGHIKEMPNVPKGYELVAGIDQGSGEELVICEALDEMEVLQCEYRMGNTVYPITWYQKPALAQ